MLKRAIFHKSLTLSHTISHMHITMKFITLFVFLCMFVLVEGSVVNTNFQYPSDLVDSNLDMENQAVTREHASVSVIVVLPVLVSLYLM